MNTTTLPQSSSSETNNSPLVSVVIPLYNKEEGVRSTIDSVLAQSYTNIEIVVMDDGSTDKSWDIVTAIPDERISCYQKPNGGAPSARNAGVNKARGELVVLLDADDLMLPDTIKNLVETRQKYGCDIAVGYPIIQEPDGREIHPISLMPEGMVKNTFKAKFYKKLAFVVGATLIPRNIYLMRQQNENLRRYEDADFHGFLARFSVAYTPRPMMIYRRQYSQMSKPCLDYTKDFIFHMDVSSCTGFWEKVRLANFYREGLSTYPEQRQLLKKMYPTLRKYAIIAKYLLKFQKLYHKHIARDYRK